MCPQGIRQENDLQVVVELPEGESLLVRVPAGYWRLLKAVARKVGGDFGMQINLGKPGEGSRFSPEAAEIVLDPLHIIESPSEAVFVAGHEGAHRAISPSPLELGLPRETVENLCRRLGFTAMQNFIEDPAVNDWMAGRYPGMKQYILDVYDDFSVDEKEGAVTPEIRELTQKIGYIPRFAKFGYQVIRRWHTGQLGVVLDPDVRLALERTAGAVDESIASIPDPQSSEGSRIIAAARARFEINTNRVWPEYKKLVEKDLRTEALRQMLIKEQGSRHMPMDKLSQEEQRKLQEAFDKLPAQRRRALREKAQRQLEDYEDALNQALAGKLQSVKQRNHKDRREEAAEEAARKKAEEQARQVSRGLEQARRARMTEYDKVYQEVAAEIEDLYTSLRRFLMPERHPRWRTGYPTGQRVDLEQVMQAVKDPARLRTLWERKTIPRRIDYRFVFLVDVSGSMLSGAIVETFKGLVVLVEVLEKLWIPNEVIAFSNKVKVFKKWGEKLDQPRRDSLAGMLEWGGGTTNTPEGTRTAVRELKNNPGKDNFLVTLTDGAPNDPGSLKELISGIERERLIRLVGIGIGPDTEGVEEFYQAYLHLPVIKPSKRQKQEGAKDFTEAMSELLEDMVRNPGKY